MKEPCRRLIDAQGSGLVEAVTTYAVLQEFLHVRSRRVARIAAAAEARPFVALFPLLETDLEDLHLGMSLYADYPRLDSADAILAAVAINRRAEALVSADKAFEGVRGLRWVDPATPALERLLRDGG